MQQNSQTNSKPISPFSGKVLPEIKKLNRFIQGLSLLKVPLLGICRPRILELTEDVARVKLPYEFLTKNHLGSMYFGALGMGSELSIALRLLDRMRREKVPVSFIFKDFSCEFLKRAETDVHFITEQVRAIDKLIDLSAGSPDRHNGTFDGYAVSATTGEKLMTYKLTISMKRFERKK
jgi:Domain of unknown function (DUF4442)